jgi:GntR family transcriptional repressor for pyruvate dehydrogenase complex
VTALTRPSLADALTGRLLALIRDGRLRPGDRLPSARSLAERFAVATPTVREALRRLEATGAVELRHGSGVYVSTGVDRVVLPNPHLGPLAGDRLRHVLDARLLIEPPLAELAATRRDPAALEALAGLLARAAGLVRGEDAELQRATTAFHAGIAAASGNGVLHEVVESLLAAHAPEQRRILELFDDRARDHEEHQAILTAVEAGRPARAATLMRAHLIGVRDTVAARLAGDGKEAG